MEKVLSKKIVWVAAAIVVAVLAYHAPRTASAIPFQ
jgi:hypothetical protein